LLVRKGGKAIIQKSWGETYYGSNKKPSISNSIYDLASVTKAIAVSTTIMHLVEIGKVNISDTLGKYVRDSRGFPLGKLTIERLLSHKTGLPPYYFSNYWLISKDLWNENTFSPFPLPNFPDPYRGKYYPKGYRKIMLRDICQLPFSGKEKTIYSDLNYILLGCLIEEVSGKRLDIYLREWLLEPMELCNIHYNPLLNGIEKSKIVPTLAHPDYHGWVNDNEAAKLAGICGASGLFSNAADLGDIGQMLVQGGKWKEKRLLQANTIKKFAWNLKPGHVRALGWQKPPMNRKLKSIAPPKASMSSFGHSGYTGTLFWVDPKKDLVIVFLTNVTYPNDTQSTFKKNAGYKTILKLVYDLV
jgi:beta-N-acetylhexosaminidase